MRRSAAPSQLLGNPAKKARFIPPAKVNSCSEKETEPLTKDLTKNSSVPSKALERVCGPNTSLSSTETLSHSTPLAKKPGVTTMNRFRPLTASLPEVNGISEHNDNEEPSAFTKYFSVVWCKASKKKHKKWEGDAVLIAKGRTVTLKNMEGKDIGKGSGYKIKDLEKLEEGQTLMIGGKEIEVMGIISAEEYNSGRCFHSAAASSGPAALECVPVKPFINPIKNASKDNVLREVQNCKPRHDPKAPNSLVLSRPTQYHQWMFNKASLPIVDVVVDPYLAIHLRPHQREGVHFLYECVMGMRLNGQFGAILADEMGLGKTLQCISLIWTLLRQGPYGSKPVLKKALIVTPGSLVKNWRKEFQKWLGTERIKVFAVDQDHRVEEFLISPLYSVLIISYEMLLRSLDQIQSLDFDLIICDEGHRLKNSSIKTTSALSSLSCSKRIILSSKVLVTNYCSRLCLHFLTKLW